jgi:Flavoprotein
MVRWRAVPPADPVHGQAPEQAALERHQLAVPQWGQSSSSQVFSLTRPAYLTADRSMRAAETSGDPVTVAASARIITHTLMSGGHLGTAITTASSHAARLDHDMPEPTPDSLSVYGALLLRGSVAAAQLGNRGTAHELLGEADDAGKRLGFDGNRRWTALGPANAKLHRVNIAVALGDAGTAIDVARKSPPRRPGLRHADGSFTMTDETPGRVLSIVVCAAGPATEFATFVKIAIERGWEVQVIVTPAALAFIDQAQVEALTGNPVRSQYSPPGSPRSRIPDAIVVAPATYNTINKWAQGSSDNNPRGLAGRCSR